MSEAGLAFGIDMVTNIGFVIGCSPSRSRISNKRSRGAFRTSVERHEIFQARVTKLDVAVLFGVESRFAWRTTTELWDVGTPPYWL